MHINKYVYKDYVFRMVSFREFHATDLSMMPICKENFEYCTFGLICLTYLGYSFVDDKIPRMTNVVESHIARFLRIY